MDKKKPEVGYNPAPDEEPKVEETPVKEDVPVEPVVSPVEDKSNLPEAPTVIIDGADTRSASSG